MTTQPSRRRRVNNLTQSLGRMAHVKSRTLAWLKLYDRGRSRDAPSSVSVHMFPSVLTLHPSPVVSSSQAQCLQSPASAWSPDLTLPVPYACSFCALPAETPHVTFNFMLPCPYVLTCASCLAKK